MTVTRPFVIARAGTAPLWRIPAAAVFLTLAAAHAGLAQTGPADLTQLPIETLMDIEVTSVSRRAQRLSDSAASVYVLTTEDIRRSGASTIPDVLRLVPGLHVGQMDSNKWSVSVRGFSGRFANKLLVLVDGRSVYTALFSGVFWNLVTVPLDDIERIEIVRGPGATLWGANAVNGVINIITRSSAVTQGGQITASTGTTDLGQTSVRYGGTIGTNATYRVDGGGMYRDGSFGLVSAGDTDTWRYARGGMRLDWTPSPQHEVMVQTGITSSRAREVWTLASTQAPYRRDIDDIAGYEQGYTMARWTRRTDGNSTLVQGGGEFTSFDEPILAERRATLDLDVQHSLNAGRRHAVIVGGNYRRSADRTTATDFIRLTPTSRALHLWSGFVQDDVQLRDGALVLTAGTKFEHNSFTGWETQPNARAIVSLPARQAVWVAGSRAVRLPSRAESDGTILGAVVPPDASSPFPRAFIFQHSEIPLPEVALGVEGGYRWQARHNLSLDASVFRTRYTELLTNTVGQPELVFRPAPIVEIPLNVAHARRASLAGAELVAEWRPAEYARLSSGYSRLLTLHDTFSGDIFGPRGAYPDTQFHLRMALTLLRQVEFDGMGRYVSALPSTGVPSYATADARIGVPIGRLDVSFIERNLLAPSHQEFVPDIIATARTRVERSAHVRVNWRF